MSAGVRFSCRQFIDLLAEALDGRLTSGQGLAFDRHLAGCPACEAYLYSYEATVGLLQAAAAEAEAGAEFPRELAEELIAAILVSQLVA